MSAIALTGSVTLVLGASMLKRLLLPLVAFVAGALIGGALFHRVPASLMKMPPPKALPWLAAGFMAFFALAQFLHWHRCHRASAECRKPLTYLVLVGGGIHNFIGACPSRASFSWTYASACVRTRC